MNMKALGGILVGAMLALVSPICVAAGAAELGGEANASLQRLYANVPAAKALGANAQAILVFPKVTKAGLGVGGQFGEGALLKNGKAVAYYNTAGASIGLQAGAQQYGYAMFFMTASVVIGSSIVMTVQGGPTAFGVPVLLTLGLFGYLMAFCNSII